MKFYFERTTILGFILVITSMISLSIYAYWSVSKAIDSSKLQSHTREVIGGIENILSTTIDMETSQRGYVITGDTTYLETYYTAQDSVNQILTHLRDLVVDNPERGKEIETLAELINEKEQWVIEVIAARHTSFEKAQYLMLTGEGKRVMDEIRENITYMQNKEYELLQLRNSQASERQQNFQLSFAGLLALITITLIVIFFSLNRNLRHRQETMEQLRQASARVQDLYNHAPCGYHSLDAQGLFVDINQTELTWLGYRAEEVVGKMKFSDILTSTSAELFKQSFSHFKEQGYIHDREFELVRKDRTTFPVLLNASAVYDEQGNYLKSRSSIFDNTARKLAEEKALGLKKELEAFSYSVSHDLRAPLRSIDGYARILKEDYANTLGVEGNRVLGIINKNAQRMGQLIDDLLDFSRLGRIELRYSVVTVNELVTGVLDDLLQHNILKIESDIAPLGTVKADMNMLRQIWINLISNAIKYSSKQEIIKLKISRIDTPKEVQFSIEDNGVGFDMKYSDKLFEVFQRLHKIQDFEGTGVGLALVKRIITRHGGRVWADSKPDQGAAFYFSLPNKNLS